MTTASNSAILDPVTNPVPTVAPQSKEDTTMSGATNKITALYCRLSYFLHLQCHWTGCLEDLVQDLPERIFFLQ